MDSPTGTAAPPAPATPSGAAASAAAPSAAAPSAAAPSAAAPSAAAPSAAAPSAAAPAQLAKAALKRIAQQRQEPTPLNFAKAWREEGGAPPSLAELGSASRSGLQALTARVLPGADAARRERLALALAGGRFDQLAGLIDSGEAAPALGWAELIERALRGVERGSKQWTTARKKDSLQRLLAANRTDAQRLQQRLAQLLASWDSEGAPPDAAPTDATAAPAAGLDEPAQDADGLSATVPADAAQADPAQAAAPQAAAPQAANAPVDPDQATTGQTSIAQAAPGQASTTLAIADAADVDADVQPESAPTSSEAPVADAVPWSRVVMTLQATVQAALPSDDARAREVSQGLRALAGRLLPDEPSLQAQSTGPVLAADADTEAGNPEPALSAAAVADALGEACAEAQRVLQHRHHLVEQLGRLVNELTDGLGDLAEDDSWVRGQCEAMRGQLDDGLTVRGVRSVSDLLRSTRLRQQQLRGERAQARDALKQLIHRMLQDIGELGEHTGRFQNSVGRYAEAIGSADSLESLAGTVREMVEETRSVHALVSQTQQRLNEEHARASALSAQVQALEDEIRRLSDEVSTDQLTQVANRRGLLLQFEAERSRAERGGAALAVALLDIDNFKKLNDTLGHATGDEALKFLARRVKELLRPTDALARFGGEEFVVLLPATEPEEAQSILTRVQRLLSAELFMHENKQTFITFSAGATRYRDGEAIEAALQRADEALYEAKRTGKNRTCVA